MEPHHNHGYGGAPYQAGGLPSGSGYAGGAPSQAVGVYPLALAMQVGLHPHGGGPPHPYGVGPPHPHGGGPSHPYDVGPPHPHGGGPPHGYGGGPPHGYGGGPYPVASCTHF